MLCNICVTSKELCDSCKHNPKYRNLKDYFIDYELTCPYRLTWCVSDPGYIKAHYLDWYKSMFGDKLPADVVKESCENCVRGSLYDDEDK